MAGASPHRVPLYYSRVVHNPPGDKTMQAVFSDGYVTFHRDKTDPRHYGTRFAKGEHGLMHRIAKWLNARGFDVIKKRCKDDGHMIGDSYQPYLRCRKPRTACRTSTSGQASTPCVGPTKTGMRAGSRCCWKRTCSEGAGHDGDDRGSVPPASRRHADGEVRDGSSLTRRTPPPSIRRRG